MGKPTGFKEFTRELPTRRPVDLRVLDWNEIYVDFPKDKLRTQAARCMDCGIPFCNNGCPLGNIIPEWNDLVYKNRWSEAIAQLLKTNNFPEFTGRVCPAPCEEACVLGINEKPVTIKNIELTIIENAWESGLIKANPPRTRTGKKVAVVGSGPAGLGCAAQLNQVGHEVTVFERADRIGGLLMYGIPEFKLEKKYVDRRIDLMREEGIKFVTNANIGVNVKIEDLQRDFDAIVLCGGATQARGLSNVPGSDLEGIYPAMTYLPQANRTSLGETIDPATAISAKGKHVIILGGGDTGADCLGTSIRQGCASVRQFELLPKPPAGRTTDMPWPYWPMILRTASAHEEGEAVTTNHRDWSINTKAFSGENGKVKKLHGIRLEWTKDPATGRPSMNEIAGSEFELDCDLCLLAMGFLGPEKQGPIEQLKLNLDPRGNIVVNEKYMTNVDGVFAAGDTRRGQSLVVWAISEGRQAARGVDEYLMGRSELPYMKLF